MAQAQLIFPFIDNKEKGFVNDPADTGSATNRGVTFRTFQAYRKLTGGKVPTIEELKRLTYDDAFEVFKRMYWNENRLDDIKAQKVADVAADWIWCSGAAKKQIQKIVGVKADGIFGAGTIEAINRQNAESLAKKIIAARRAYNQQIVARSVADYTKKIGRQPTQSELLKYTKKRFEKGWEARISDLEKTLDKRV